MKIRNGVYLYREKGTFDANTYLIKDELTVLIDPGLEKYLVPQLKDMQDDGIEPQDIDVIAITHLHPDHCGAIAALEEISSAKVALHPIQHDYIEIMAEESLKFLGGCIAKRFSAGLVLKERLNLGKAELEILHTPGHSPESICLYAPDKKILICGDLVFEKSVGRADLPFGDPKKLKSSIDKVSALDTELLLPGHGAIIEGRSKVKRNFEFVKETYFNLFL